MSQINDLIKSNRLLIISISMLIINLFFILFLASFERIVYIIFFYHVSSAWLTYFSFSVSLICHLLYLKNEDINWSRLGKCSVIIGIAFSAVTLITGSLWYNATSGGYRGIYWSWGDARQTTTLILFISYLSYLFFGNMIEERDKKAKLTAILGIVLFPTIPLSYLSALLFPSLHPRITPIQGQSGHIYWDTIKIFILLFNLFAITILFVYLLREFVELVKAQENLNELIQKRLEEE